MIGIETQRGVIALLILNLKLEIRADYNLLFSKNVNAGIELFP